MLFYKTQLNKRFTCSWRSLNNEYGSQTVLGQDRAARFGMQHAIAGEKTKVDCAVQSG